MSIDRGDAHLEDAGSEENAYRHIGLFLWWALERELGSAEHDAKSAALAPTKYFVDRCDTKLWESDFTKEGQAFAAAEYNHYLAEVHAYAKALGVSDDYSVPESAETVRHFFEWLDERLTRWRQRLG